MYSLLIIISPCGIIAQGGISVTPGREVWEGDNITLQCSHQDEGEVIWVREPLDHHGDNEKEVVAHGELILLNDERLGVKKDTQDKTFVSSLFVSFIIAMKRALQTPPKSYKFGLLTQPLLPHPYFKAPLTVVVHKWIFPPLFYFMLGSHHPTPPSQGYQMWGGWGGKSPPSDPGGLSPP